MVRTGGYATGISAGSFMKKETGNAMYVNSITECVKRLPIMWHYEPIEFDDIVMKICRNLEIARWNYHRKTRHFTNSNLYDGNRCFILVVTYHHVERFGR